MIGAMNPAVRAAEVRTLGLTATPQTVAATQAAAAQGVAPAGAAGAAVEASAAAPGEAGAQATMGAEAVQSTPPQPAKIILSSVLKGAATGASAMFGINSFGGSIPFVKTFMTNALKFIPFLKITTFPVGPLVALGVGAVVGGVVGLVGGLRKAKAATAEFQKQQEAIAQQQAAAAAQQVPVGPDGQPLAVGPDGQPIAVGPDGQPLPADGAAPAGVDEPKAEPANGKAKGAKKNPVMDDDYKGTSSRKKGKADKSSKTREAGDEGGGQRYHIKRGDTLWALSRRFGVSIDDIVKANPKIKDPDLIYAGDTIRIPTA